MRTDITHLPSQVQTDLKFITTFLLKHVKTRLERTGRRQTNSCIRYLLLHGCFTEDHWQPDTELRSDEVSYRYNIMVIISAHLSDIIHSLEDAVAQLNQSGDVSFPIVTQIVDTPGRIGQKLKNGYLAYDQIQTRAIQLYSKGNTTHDLFEIPDQPHAGKHYVQARDYFDHTYPLAELFLSGARSFKDKNPSAAGFMLNLSIAQAYEALMAIHTLRYPLARPLYDLRELAESIHPELSMIWAGVRGEQSFDLLAKAFSNVLFSGDYHVTDGGLNLMFGYVEDLHKLVHHICQIKFEALKDGSLAKPQKDWLEVVRQALKPPEDPIFSDDDEGEEPELQKATIPDPSPVIRTAEQEEALEKLHDTIFGIEEPCFDLETLGDVLKSMAWNDDTDESRGIELLGRYVQDQATVVMGIFRQMCVLLKEIPLRKDAPAKEEGARD